ncbi:ankyrin repeat-containing protein BDA1-like [Rhodamnia argentea]|uniref:Ankyrin repeat-containing protein BDA1-like n=1 Tax=Rhodamnia argentea TaxID=178133 RepID=A0A8B8P6S5_9MYRT|nr:ankyrin repeat-containing protein BDA1-like [Rhodamnia argentea]
MESELYEATVKGNVPSLLELLGKDKLLLDRIMIGNHTETPLHIAAMLGHLEFVEEVLAWKAELARVQSSQGLTPLQLAAAKGYLNIVASLLRVGPEICFVRDKYKRNPLHVAAMKGHVDVLEYLVRARPDAARSVIEHGQTILHLCVKHNRLEALKLLIDILGDDQFINSKDEDGNTILHLAAADRQIETIDFLINKEANLSITNSRGFTVLGLLAQGQSAERVSEIMESVPRTLENPNNPVTTSHPPVGEEDKKERKRKWQKSMHQSLMVVATLVATIAFQAGMTQTDKFDNHLDEHRDFIVYNTISFIASLSVILLLISGLPLKRRRISTWIVMLTMWVAITSTAATYGIILGVFSPEEDKKHADDAGKTAVQVWVRLMEAIFLCHIVRLILKLARKVLKFVSSALKKQKPRDHIP